MNRFLKEYGNISRKFRGMYFFSIIWMIVAICIIMYGEGIDKTYKDAFNYDHSVERTYYFTYTGKAPTVINNQAIRDEVKLNTVLSESTEYDYVEYLITEAETEVAIPDEINTSSDQAGTLGAKNKFKVLFMDENFAKKFGLYEDLKVMFEQETDYPDSVSASFGQKWFREGFSAPFAKADMEIATTLGTYNLWAATYIKPGAYIEIDGTQMSLDDVVVLPLKDVTADKFPSIEKTRNIWHEIYTLKNKGVIMSTLGANEIQREVDKRIKETDLDGRIIIDGSDYNSRIIFHEDLEELVAVVRKVSFAAIIFGIALMVFFAIMNFRSNRQYYYLMYLTGTGKTEMTFATIIQSFIYLLFTVVTSYAAALGIGKMFSIKVASPIYILYPTVFATVICLFLQIVMIAFWKPGKFARLTKDGKRRA